MGFAKSLSTIAKKGAEFAEKNKDKIGSVIEKGEQFAEKHKDEISSLSDIAEKGLDNSRTNGETKAQNTPTQSNKNNLEDGIPILKSLPDLTKGFPKDSIPDLSKGLPGGLPKLPGGIDPQKALGSLQSVAKSATEMFSPQSNNNVDTIAASIASGEKLVDLLKRDLDNRNLGIKPEKYTGTPGPKFYDIIGDDLKKLLMENDEKNFKKINNVLVNYIINEGINFAKADQYILKKFVGSLLKNNEKIFKPILTKTIQETLPGKENGKAILEIFKRKLCSDLTLVKHIKPNQKGGSEPLPLTNEEREKIFALFEIYLRPHYTGLLTNQKILNQAIIPGIKQSLRTKEAEKKIQEVLIPEMVKFINLNFKDLLNHNDDIIKQILLMTLNSTCTYNRELATNRTKVSPEIEEAFIEAIDNNINAVRLNKDSVNLSPEIYADTIFNHIVDDLMYQSVKIGGGKAKKTQKKHKKTTGKNRKTNRKSKNLKSRN